VPDHKSYENREELRPSLVAGDWFKKVGYEVDDRKQNEEGETRARLSLPQSGGRPSRRDPIHTH